MEHDFVWFIEDDVYFYNENTVKQIDLKYPSDELLSGIYHTNPNGTNTDWHWKYININLSPPYYCGMMCAVRFGKSMCSHMNQYVDKNKTLFFLEAMFPTIAISNKLQYSNPVELNTIHWRHDFTLEQMNSTNLFHPVKQIDKHLIFRTKN